MENWSGFIREPGLVLIRKTLCKSETWKKNQVSDYKSVEILLSPNASSLYIFFGGIAGAIGMPSFEFYNASKIIKENKIFLRDFSQCWYQNGLAGVSNNIQSTAMYIKTQIGSIKPDKIFFVGNSMGGYAAILFSEIIGQGEVIAFSPQTFISPLLRLKYKDFRWQKQIITTYRNSLFHRYIWDTKPLLSKERKSRKLSIFVSKNDRIDMIHAKHIKGEAGVQVFEFEDGGHGLVKLLRDEGHLPRIMLGKYI